MPRRKTGARSIRWRASSVQVISGGAVCGEASELMAWLLVQQLLQFFPGLKERDFLGRDRNGRAGFRVASFLHATAAQPEAAESTNLRLVAPMERVADAVEHGVNHDLR